jgi:hypothetical protein
MMRNNNPAYDFGKRAELEKALLERELDRLSCEEPPIRLRLRRRPPRSTRHRVESVRNR